jgi:adenosine deaminase
MTLETFIAGMPKAELHLHLEGTLEPELTRELADRNGIAMEIGENTFTDLTTFLAAYYPRMSVLVTEQDFYDLAWGYLEKAHSQNVIHVEMFFDPQAHTSRGVPFATVIEGYHRAVMAARSELGMSAQLIMCILRDHSVDSAAETLEASLFYKDWIVGIGLDSDERDNPPLKFAEVFAKARAEGYRVTMHCDIDQIGSIENIRQVIEEIGVDRIDHGTNILEDPRLVEIARERGLGFTSCPLSNGIVTEGMKSVEIVSLLRAGLKVTINSDDPAYFDGYLTENLLALAAATDLDENEFVRLQRNAFEISWVDESARDRFLAELDGYVSASRL